MARLAILVIIQFALYVMIFGIYFTNFQIISGFVSQNFNPLNIVSASGSQPAAETFGSTGIQGGKATSDSSKNQSADAMAANTPTNTGSHPSFTSVSGSVYTKKNTVPAHTSTAISFIKGQHRSAAATIRLLDILKNYVFQVISSEAYASKSHTSAPVTPSTAPSAAPSTAPSAASPDSTITTPTTPATLTDWQAKLFKNGKSIVHGNTNQTQVCLTFDDGMDGASVERVLDVLKANNIQCTFFVTGEALRLNKGLWQRAISEGHQICNHTLNHKSLLHMSDAAITEEITGWETCAIEILGQEYVKKMKSEFPFIRFPSGSGAMDARVLSLAAKNGYLSIYWTLETYNSILQNHNLKKDSPTVIAGEVSAYISKSTSNGNIVLLHFNVYDSTNLDQTVKAIKANGHNCVPLSTMLSQM